MLAYNILAVHLLLIYLRKQLRSYAERKLPLTCSFEKKWCINLCIYKKSVRRHNMYIGRILLKMVEILDMVGKNFKIWQKDWIQCTQIYHHTVPKDTNSRFLGGKSSYEDWTEFPDNFFVVLAITCKTI